MPRRYYHCTWLLISLFVVNLALPSHQPTAYASPAIAPSVSYDSVFNTIYIGSNSGALDSEALALPDLAAAPAVAANNLLLDQGNGIWLLKASVVISHTGQLLVNSAVAELHLDSPAIDIATQKSLNISAKNGGHLVIDGTNVSAWENGAQDKNPINGRSYLLALTGSRMDITNSELHHLGYSSGEPSGISWRSRTDNNDPKTGSTGTLIHNNIHDNYFGMYSYAAYGVKIINNDVHDNIGYGLDPHTGTQMFEVANNRVYNNHYHGIIFSRDCINNWIHDNTVHDNDEHGIMMDRGSDHNLIENNIVYNNDDAFSIFESSYNTITHNIAYNNNRGVRINATFDATDLFDGVSTGNRVISNTLTDNGQYGIYLYARADRNMITDNKIISTTLNGIYIRAGGNQIQNNTIQKAGVGISIVGGDKTPAGATQPLENPGYNNLVSGGEISTNSSTGVRIMSGVNNTISNVTIKSNTGGDGIAISKVLSGTASTGNQILGNRILNNGRYGILIKDATSAQNKLSQNLITGNAAAGIKMDPGAQGGILPPAIVPNQPGPHLVGTALAGATVELYSDPGGQGGTYLGQPTLSGTNWGFDLLAGQNPKQVTALQIDTAGNSSAFNGNGGGASLSITKDISGQTTINVTGAGAVVTLPEILSGLGISNTNPPFPIRCGSGHLLENTDGVWQVNANLFIGPNVTLDLGVDSSSKEIKLCSLNKPVNQARTAKTKFVQSDDASVSTMTELNIDALSFVNIRTYNGIINIDHAYIHSWDPVAQTFDVNDTDGRAYLLAKYDAEMNIRDSELSYLGSLDDESYGIAWRDINDTVPGSQLRTRVTGTVIGNKIHDNRYGIYTFQATDMTFSHNDVYHNLGYGFDPHDYTHNVLMDSNLSHDNGTHGFIISRGCNNFIFINNQAYRNVLQGFMLDPGAEKSIFLPAQSHDNLYTGNSAYDNGGFGIRIYKASSNTFTGNHLYRNGQGLVIDDLSVNNIVDSNVITQNLSYGLVTQNFADNNTISNNIVNSNANPGLYIHSSGNTIVQNTANLNAKAGILLVPVVGGSTVITNNVLMSNTVTGNTNNGIDLHGNVQRTLISGNQISNNAEYGAYLSGGPTSNSLVRNKINANSKFGILATGPATQSNLWSENQIYGNALGAVSITNSANGGVVSPLNLVMTNGILTGAAPAGSQVEIFADSTNQAQFFLSRVTADATGIFSLVLPAPLPAAHVTALLIDSRNNGSIVSGLAAIATPTPTATATVPPGATVTATPVPGATLTPTATPGPTSTPVVNGATGSQLFLPLIQR